MKKFLLVLAVLLLIPHVASATFIVNQYQGYGTTGLAGVDAAIATGTPDVSAEYEYVDFTDDPSFGGVLPFDNPWPLAGVKGTTNPLNQNFAANILGNIYISEADNYTFMTYNDDGARLRIDGINVIVDNNYHPEVAFFGNLFLSEGLHSLELGFFEYGGEASLELLGARGIFGAYDADNFHLVGASDGIPSPPAVPEPATMVLLGSGLAGFFGFRKKFIK